LSVKNAQSYNERTYELFDSKFKLNTEIYWVAEPFYSKVGFQIHCLVKFNCEDPLKHKKDLIKALEIVTKGSYRKKYNWTSIVPYEASLRAKYLVVKGISRNDVEYGFL
jgi:hypothetical protein